MSAVAGRERGSVGGVIAHVALETAPADAAAATAFWQELGFVLVDPPPTLADRAAWLERHGTQIHLLWTEHPTAQQEGHVAIVVADYPATLDRLRAAAETTRAADRQREAGMNERDQSSHHPNSRSS